MTQWFAAAGRAARRIPLTLLVIVTTGVFLGWAWAGVPTEKVGWLSLQLVFEGVDRGHYPNKMLFSPADVVARPVLRVVYDRRGLASWGSFDDFARGFFVEQSNDQLEAVHTLYRTALGNAKLSSVDRVRLEADYRTKLELVAGQPEVAVGFRQSERFGGLRALELEDIVKEVVEEWADASRRLRGSGRLDVEAYGPRALALDGLQSAEFLAGVDVLRTGLARLRRNLAVLERKPEFAGARLVGEDISFADLQAEVTGVLEGQVEPLLRQGIAEGAVRDVLTVRNYYATRRAVSALSLQRLRSRAAGVETAFREYSRPAAAGALAAEAAATSGSASNTQPALIPQVSEAFIDRLLQMSDVQADVEFRQRLTGRLAEANARVAVQEVEARYYADMEALVLAMRVGPAAEGTPAHALLRHRLDAAASAALSAAGRAERMYLEASARSLDDGSPMYRIVRGFEQKAVPAASRSRALVVALVLLGLTAGIGLALDWGVRSLRQ